MRVFGDLEALGVQFSIDDFGTSSSSLAHLRWLHVDEIKIDHPFLSGFAATGSGGATGATGSDQTAVDDIAILTSIVDLAHTLACNSSSATDNLRERRCPHGHGHARRVGVPARACVHRGRRDDVPGDQLRRRRGL